MRTAYLHQGKRTPGGGVDMSVESIRRDGRQLEQADWADYFNELDRRLEGGELLEATIEIVSDPVEGTEVERLPLNSITWEDGDDQIAIGVGGRGRRYPSVLWHFVDKPRKLWVTEEEERSSALIVESDDETLTLVRVYPE
jgi:uncharacterized protein DUF5335